MPPAVSFPPSSQPGNPPNPYPDYDVSTPVLTASSGATVVTQALLPVSPATMMMPTCFPKQRFSVSFSPGTIVAQVKEASFYVQTGESLNLIGFISWSRMSLCCFKETSSLQPGFKPLSVLQYLHQHPSSRSLCFLSIFSFSKKLKLLFQLHPKEFSGLHFARSSISHCKPVQ